MYQIEVKDEESIKFLSLLHKLSIITLTTIKDVGELTPDPDTSGFTWWKIAQPRWLIYFEE